MSSKYRRAKKHREREKNDTTEFYRELRRDQQARNMTTLAEHTAVILKLAELGFTVRRLSDYHFRVDDAVDFHPVNCRYHAIKGGERGSYTATNPLEILQMFIPEKAGA